MASIKLETDAFNRHVTQKVVNAAGKNFGMGLRAVAIQLLRNIVIKRIDYKHPVDTGRCRAGWYASWTKLGMGAWQAEGKDPKAQTEGKRLGQYQENLQGKTIWINMINGVKYAIYLEYGHSRQAPAGMVRYNMRKMYSQAPGLLAPAALAAWNTP